MAWQPWKFLNFSALGTYELLCSEKRVQRVPEGKKASIFCNKLLRMKSNNYQRPYYDLLQYKEKYQYLIIASHSNIVYYFYQKIYTRTLFPCLIHLTLSLFH